MANKVYCKWCGTDRSSVSSLVNAGSCSKSPTKQHEAFDGEEQSKYYCEFCGTDRSSISSLVNAGSCSKSPTKNHQPAR